MQLINLIEVLSYESSSLTTVSYGVHKVKWKQALKDELKPRRASLAVCTRYDIR